MASLPATKTRQSFIQKGFIAKEGPHHFYLFYHEGKLIAKTMVSHNDQDIGDKLISKMYKQCKMDKNFFIDFAKCHKSKADYIELLKNNGHL
jgi:predicted RNA binding protein YcfA (HicA-like mRNA interferase family)